MSSPKNSVIIVNKNRDLVNLFRDALEQHRFETLAFTDPSVALKEIKSNPDHFSIMLTDYPASRGSERKFTKEVKAANENIKVILISGYNFSAVDVSKDGYDRFLQLPVKLSTLVSTMKEMLDS